MRRDVANLENRQLPENALLNQVCSNYKALVCSRCYQSKHSIWHIVNPHQRCGYSDSPFARIHYFYTAGSRNGLEGWTAGVQIDKNGHNSTNMSPKNQFYAGDSISERRKAFGTGPEPQNGPKTCKKMKNAGFGPSGQFHTSLKHDLQSAGDRVQNNVMLLEHSLAASQRCRAQG